MHRQPTEATVENPDHPKSLSITRSCGQFFRPNSSLIGGRRGPHTGELQRYDRINEFAHRHFAVAARR
jgi:hypothetical protein